MFSEKSRSLLCGSVLATVAALTAGHANASFIGTFVNADTSNTSPGSAIVTTGSENDNDNLWFLRTQSGTRGGTVLTSNGPSEDSPMLTTTVSGLANGTYNVYVAYWGGGSDTWLIQAAIAGNPLVQYTGADGTVTDTYEPKPCWARLPSQMVRWP